MKTIQFYLFICFVNFSFSGIHGQEITNEDIWGYQYYANYISGFNSMKDGKHYSSLEQDENGRSQIVKKSFEGTSRNSIILNSATIFGKSMNNIGGYTFSQDESKILIESGSESIYRHSYVADYHIYDRSNESVTRVNDPNLGKIRLAEFSPDGTKVAYVRDNNIFIYDIGSKSESQVTTDGVYNEIINGYPDWVYEEEFGFSKGFYWSPGSDRIAYYKFDESKVREFNMEFYNDELYPDPYKFKYPKAGEANSKVSILVYNLADSKSTLVNLGTETDIYVPRIKWTTSNTELCIMRLNRHQNHLEILLADVSQKSLIYTPRKIYNEKSDTYIEINDNLRFLDDGESFVWNSDRDGYNHLYVFNMKSETKTKPYQLTQGEWDVIDFYGLDEENMMFYYSSSQISALEKHVFKKGVRSRYFKQLSTRKGSNSATFSDTYEYIVMNNSSANTPYHISLLDKDGEELRVLEDNNGLSKKLKDMDLPQKEFFTFKNSNGDELNCWMIKPKNFESRKKHPVFVTIYGGPGHNTVTDSWGGSNYMWHQMLASKGYIVVSCDPRGTMYRGKAFEHSTYLQLGKHETDDFIDFAKHLQGLPYVDKDRIGIQGWSYGGYMTSLCMTKGADYFKAGIAVAPVTNWKWYDSIYTERFMRTPAENQSGYDDNSPINHVEKLKGKYMIVHGSGDDNVHAQNTMEMVNALVNANKDFDMFIYPNKNHGIYGGPARLNLYNKMTNFILDNL